MKLLTRALIGTAVCLIATAAAASAISTTTGAPDQAVLGLAMKAVAWAAAPRAKDAPRTFKVIDN